MTTIIVIAVVVNLILSILVANMGSKRQLGSTGAFFLSFLFSPILGILFVIASERLTAGEITEKIKISDNTPLKKLNYVEKLELTKEQKNKQNEDSKRDKINILLFLFIFTLLLVSYTIFKK